MTRETASVPLWRSLSARLLVLTLVFVMVAEVLIYAPSIGRYRKTWMEGALGDGHLAVLALEATPDGMVDERLRERLLSAAGVMSVALDRDGTMLMLGAVPPTEIDRAYTLAEHDAIDWIAQAFALLVRAEDRVIGIAGPSPRAADTEITVVLREEALRYDMLGYSQRILWLSIIISVITAALVFLALFRDMVRPMQRLTEAMTRFRQAPEDPTRLVAPSTRPDEIGVAQRTLAEMQHDLRAALAQRARMASVGEEVTRISHDLRGILSSAMLVSDRLEQSADPEVRRITPTILHSLDRAVNMCTRTLRYVREGTPVARPQSIDLAVLAAQAGAALDADGRRWKVALPAGFTVQADPEMMERVLGNLGRNAFEAGAETVAVRAAPETATCHAIEIVDDGPGLPEQARSHLFQPFSGSARAGGTGLGLAIVRELMTAQDGAIDLLRTGAGGTVFRLTLPKGRPMG